MRPKEYTYARQILKDIKTGTLEVVEGKTFLQYIQEYQEKTIRSNIHAFADIFGIDEDEMFSLYVATRKWEVDVLRLDRLEATANKEKLKSYYNAPIFKAHVKLHQDLKEYIEGRKADNLEGVDLYAKTEERCEDPKHKASHDDQRPA